MTDRSNTHVIAHVDDVMEHGRVVAQVEGREIAVFYHDGGFVAYLNWCAHQGGPCAEGPITGTTVASYDRASGEVETRWDREGEILNCPWHGWEYDLTTGECLSRSGKAIPSYPVQVEEDYVVLSLNAVSPGPHDHGE